jgi:hypothetical protein
MISDGAGHLFGSRNPDLLQNDIIAPHALISCSVTDTAPHVAVLDYHNAWIGSARKGESEQQQRSEI